VTACRLRTGRLARLLRFEDVLLGTIAFLGLPLVDRLTGPGTGAGSAAETPSALAGLAGLIAILGVLLCLCTRGPDEPPPLSDGQLTLQGWARFPLAAGIGVVGIETLPGIGLDGDPFVGLAFLVVLITVMIPGRLPVLPVAARRALVTPMAIVATGAFDQVMGSGLGELLGGALRGGAPPEIAGFLPLIVGAAAVMYVMLVVAPRAIADPGASGFAWAVRFLFLLAALAAGDVLFGAIG
jgi:hypothetical protein